MKIAIIGTNPYYESDRVLYEALKKGHEAVFLPKGRIVETNYFNDGTFGIYFAVPSREEQIKMETNFPDIQPLELKIPVSFSPTIQKAGFLSKKNEVVSKLYSLEYFDAFLIREISKNLEWATILVSHLLSHKKVVVDQKIGTEMYYKSKHGTFYKATSSGFPYPKTFAVTSAKTLSTMLDLVLYPQIVKVSQSSKGLGVYKCTSKAEVLDLIKINSLRPRELLFQEYIDYSGDVRVFVIGNKVLGAMRREPQEGQWKGNVAQGAKAYPIDIAEPVKKLALDIVALQNSEIIGVDIMLPKTGPVIIESNRAPQFHGFEEATGINIGKEIVEYLERKYEKLSGSKN